MSTKIEWVKNPDGTAGKTWNPITGCTKISPGCQHCYAERMSKRLAGRCGYPADEPFRVTVHPDKFDEPLHWRKPAHIFVCSMADLFHPKVRFGTILRVVRSIIYTPWNTYQILTKRPSRMREFFEYWMHMGTKAGYLDPMMLALDAGGPPISGEQAARANEWYKTHCDQSGRGLCDLPIPWPLPNVWLGVTVESGDYLSRIDDLMATPAAVRFVSMEPLLGPVNLRPWLYDPRECSCYEAEYGHQLGCMFHGMTGDAVRAEMAKPWPVLDWVIVGGETGPGARPMHPDWVRDVRDQCVAANVPFFFKGWGSWAPLPEPFTYTPAVGSGNREYNLALGRYRKKHRATLLLDDRPEGWPPYMIRQGTGLTDGEGGMARVGKKAAGRLLDGREWNQMPGDQL
ncbi:MAG TPA: phage Gp37/Gp68 family protein [Phycisphaerae bacterium]|nr:phage Gp37/Gp68 family protein [Phycisphaerae bacterium]